MLDFYQADECCGPDLAADILEGLLEGSDQWVHQACGQEWRAEPKGEGVRYWIPHCPLLLFGQGAGQNPP